MTSNEKLRIILKRAEIESIKKSEQIILEAKKKYDEKMRYFEEEFSKELKNKKEEIKKIAVETAYNMCIKVLKNKKNIDNNEDFKNFIFELERTENEQQKKNF